MKVREASSAADYAAVAALMRAFIDWHYERHSSDRGIIDSYFDPAAYEVELRTLQVISAPLAGRCLSQKKMGALQAA